MINLRLVLLATTALDRDAARNIRRFECASRTARRGAGPGRAWSRRETEAEPARLLLPPHVPQRRRLPRLRRRVQLRHLRRPLLPPRRVRPRHLRRPLRPRLRRPTPPPPPPAAAPPPRPTPPPPPPAARAPAASDRAASAARCGPAAASTPPPPAARASSAYAATANGGTSCAHAPAERRLRRFPPAATTPPAAPSSPPPTPPPSLQTAPPPPPLPPPPSGAKQPPAPHHTPAPTTTPRSNCDASSADTAPPPSATPARSRQPGAPPPRTGAPGTPPPRPGTAASRRHPAPAGKVACNTSGSGGTDHAVSRWRRPPRPRRVLECGTLRPAPCQAGRFRGAGPIGAKRACRRCAGFPASTAKSRRRFRPHRSLAPAALRPIAPGAAAPGPRRLEDSAAERREAPARRPHGHHRAGPGHRPRSQRTVLSSPQRGRSLPLRRA